MDKVCSCGRRYYDAGGRQKLCARCRVLKSENRYLSKPFIDELKAVGGENFSALHYLQTMPRQYVHNAVSPAVFSDH